MFAAAAAESPLPAAAPHPCPAPDAGGGRDAFLIPSVFGDEPQLRDLRARLRGVLRFDMLALPDAGARGALLTDMAATGRMIAHEIERRRPTGPVALVGYSFGASMALEVAAQLAEAGRRVSFLAVLDGPFEPPTVAPRPGPSASVLAAPRRLLKTVAVDAVGSMNTVRRLVAKAATPDAEPGDRAEAMRRAMLWHLRNKALKGWSPRGCPALGLRVTTGDYGTANAARWAELCPNLHVVAVEAVHEHLLKDDALDAVSYALIAAVRRSEAAFD
ncbi:thioesterase domain-containing protein [Lichenibacterium dinghuense]|uniref:thioesterase domain-containing protein n=1 Tax=Lichenibacterium dinghuense TaxID=2895977 RepID=UPI001F00D4DC|nr:alpha/beta fold hydrolase [Lichenibacterium sp. 6Y81]